MGKNYKDTLNLPKTDFPMKAGLVQREPERLAQWESERLYEKIQEARKEAPLFVLHDGPPFANGDVHMGTALNKVLKDLVVKSKTMLGFRAPFIPGWDCHGLPIEFKVVKESRGLSPLEVRQKSEAYARRYIDIQRSQFKRLGVLGDWDHPYLTLDPGYEAQILRAFGEFVKRGLVYQSKKPVYWSTGAQTALAEAEVEYADRTDPAIFVKFPIVSGDLAGRAAMVIWTTTPWTLPANAAIAVHERHRYVAKTFRHAASGRTERLMLAESLVAAFCEATGWEALPDDESETFRGSDLDGLEAQHPFLDRHSKVILGDFVTLETGTGQVHVAPGHGSDDYLAGMKYGLPVLSPVDDNGRFTDEVGMPEWVGKYVFDANKDVVEFLRGNGSLLGEQDYLHSYPHCWRSKTPVVFRAVEQFFIRIDDIRAQALEAIDQVEWLPGWGRNRIYGTVESRPDWCISRQRSWGVPLPVFFDPDGKAVLDPAVIAKVADLVEKHGTNVWFEKNDAEMAAEVGLSSDHTRRTDTLDVWIDSGVSHQAVVARHPALQFPADVYLEATDQHRGWFQSSLMTSIALTGRAPYRTVITHGFVVDRDTRKKVSKSEQGTSQKPMNAEHFVGQYGADIVRLWTASVDYQNEVPFSEETFKGLADTYRRMRNTLRILLANLSDQPPDAAGEPTLIDRWIASRLQEVIATCREAYAAFEFHKVYVTLNQFCAVDLSSLYIDITKDRMYCDAAGSPRRRATQKTMRDVFEALCRLLAPILAYTADEAWRFAGHADSVHLEEFPAHDPSIVDAAALDRVAVWLDLRGAIAQAIEKARDAKEIGNALEAAVRLEVADAGLLESLESRREELEEFFILSDLTLAQGAETAAFASRTSHVKCERCWRHRPSVGNSREHPELCDRCETVVSP